MHQSHKISTIIQKFYGIQKLRLKRWQSQIIWKCLAEIYEVEPEAFGPVSVRKNPCKDLDDVNEIDFREYQVKVKTKMKQIKRGYSPRESKESEGKSLWSGHNRQKKG